jgi:hypothetical protein
MFFIFLPAAQAGRAEGQNKSHALPQPGANIHFPDFPMNFFLKRSIKIQHVYSHPFLLEKRKGCAKRKPPVVNVL